MRSHYIFDTRYIYIMRSYYICDTMYNLNSYIYIIVIVFKYTCVYARYFTLVIINEKSNFEIHSRQAN